jgi:hypothetical protein
MLYALFRPADTLCDMTQISHALLSWHLNKLCILAINPG